MSHVLYLFDIDGTLLLSGGAGARALNVVFERRYGLRGAMDSVCPGGKTDPLILVEIFANHFDRNPTEQEIDEILAEYIPCLHTALESSERFRLMPGVVEILDFLAGEDHVHLAVATGNTRSGARAKLEHARLWERFPQGGFGDDSADRAALVQTAIDRSRAHAGIDFASDRIVVVGDTPRDVSAARSCGVRVLTVATGTADRATLEAAEPDAVFDTLAELEAWHRAHMSAAATT